MDADRYRSFAAEIEDVKKRALAKVGPEDVGHVKRLDRFSRVMEVVGRGLIHVSPEPITFSLGVLALFVHKQLQAAEIGHTSLHGVYDKLEGAEKFASKSFRWDVPIDEESWRGGHNVRHHGNTNVAGKDPDIHFGMARLTTQTPHRWFNFLQLPFVAFVLAPNFTFLMNLHFTGLYDVFFDNGLPQKLDVLPDRSKKSVTSALRKSLRKWAPYYLKNYVFFPLLAGPMFWKVLLGNWMAETLRDVYSFATIFCGHVGEHVASYPVGTKTQSKGQWYAMQVEASNDFEVSRPLSILCGGLDRQIEHHLFPTLPPDRLREIAPEVRAICKKYGVDYKTSSWPEALRQAFVHVGRLSQREGGMAVLREMA